VGNHPTAGTAFGVPGLPGEGKEAVDRRSLALEQESLVRTVFRANPTTVCVLLSSFPYAIVWSQHNLPAILHMTHGGQETGTALAGVLFGDANPAGRLVQTWPRSADQLPPMPDYDIRAGRTYMYVRGEPLYPFGHGRSYTTFAYSRLTVTPRRVPVNARLAIHVEVTNTGGRDGDEVVQLYVRYRESSVPRPNLELRGFQRVFVPRGKTVDVAFALAPSDLAFWDAPMGRWRVERGRVEILVGASSADLRLSEVVEIG
jgi:beta-glucosidase